MLCFHFQDYVGDTIVESGNTYVVINSEYPQESYVHQVAYRTEEGAPTGSCYIFRNQQSALLCAAALTGTQLSTIMGLDATKPVFRVSNKVSFKPACSATETR